MGFDKKRAEELTDYFTSDEDRARKIFALPLKTACKIINADGFDFTEEELKTYADYILSLFSDSADELDETEMKDISGGRHGTLMAEVFQVLKYVAYFNWK